MRIVFTAVPAYGHVNPMVPLALACEAAGHEVTFAVGAPFDAQLPLRTRTLPVSSESVRTASDRAWSRMAAGEAVDVAMTEMFGADLADPTAAAMLSVLEDERPDVLVIDQIDPGAGVAAATLGIPFAWFANTAPHASTSGCRAFTFGRHPSAGDLGRRPAIDPTLPALRRDGYPEDIFAVPMRPEAWSHEATIPGWLEAESEAPRVLLTLGTEFNVAGVLGDAARSTADEGVEVLLALGPRLDPADLGDLPETVHVERFVAQHLVLPRVDAVVHHGGTGTVVGAVANALPQVLVPQGADQFWNSQRIVAAGAGIHAGGDASDVGAAVAAVVPSGSPQRAAARRLRLELEAMPSPASVVARLEELC